MSDDEIDGANSEQPLSDVPHSVWQYFAIANHTDAKKSGAKNAICAFCDISFSGCSTSRAAAHIVLIIVGRPVFHVLGQSKAGMHPCIEINKKDGDIRGAFKNAQKTIGGIKRKKEQCMEGKKRKQQVMDELLKLLKTAKWWQGLGIQTNSRCSLGIMKIFSHLTVCLQRAMSSQAQVGVAGKAWTGSFSGS